MNSENSSMSPNSRKTKHSIPADSVEIPAASSVLAEQRILKSQEQAHDSYCFQCGKTPVRVCFASDGKDLGQILKSYFLSRKR